MAAHLDCTRAYIRKLRAKACCTVRQMASRFQLDQNRVAYLRRERRQSPRSEADADHVKVKTEMLQPRLMEKKRELVRQEDVDELRDMLEGRGVAPRNDDSQRHGPARGGNWGVSGGTVQVPPRETATRIP
jgi:hypothetical protein